MLLYVDYYRKFGIRRPQQLIAPTLSALELLELPQASILHFIGSSAVEAGPAGDEFIFRKIARPIMMQHIVTLAETKGAPRPVPGNIQAEIRRFHTTNRRYRLAQTLEQGVRDRTSALVFNYTYLHRQYRYMRSFYSEFNRWHNIYSTVWQNIAKVAKETDRQHFLQIRLPKILPSISDLRMAMEDGFIKVLDDVSQGTRPSLLNLSMETFAEINSLAKESNVDATIALEALSQRALGLFSNPESMLLLELWKWAGAERDTSVISHVSGDALSRVNLILEESGRFVVLNLGEFNSWRKATSAELAKAPNAPTKGYEPKQAQLRLLSMMMSVFQLRTGVVEQPANPAEAQTKVPEQSATLVKQEVGLPKVDPATGAIGIAVKKEVIEEDPVDNAPPEPTSDREALLQDEQIEAELNDLDRVTREQIQRQLEESAIALTVPTVVNPEDGVMAKADELAEQGVISAAEYRRFQKASETYKTMLAPDGKTSMADFIKVDPEVLKIEQSPRIRDIKTVPDKTMLKSSLLTFDETYIKNVMERDVMGTVVSMQNAAIAITGVEKEVVEDAMGSYTAYTVRALPVEGSPSTWRFKLPTLAEDGTYYANGVKYRMRKQRADLPIRKISINSVALTSYYGKTFVDRSEKKVNDYGNWLRNHVMAAGLDQDNQTITDMMPGQLFVNDLRLPRQYTTFSQGFRSFTINTDSVDPDRGQFQMFWDYGKRDTLFSPDAMKIYERNGMVLCGKTGSGKAVVMDPEGALYLDDGRNATELPAIEELLNVNPLLGPVEYTELRVMGKSLPVGVVLASEMGLERLMQLLKVTPRRVPAGQRLNLDRWEFPVVFSDETLVFSREDRLASLILAGFNAYHRVIRNFSVYEFDRKDVYFNVLEQSGLSVRYLREVTLMYQLFVDNITRDLLIEMKEPTDFRGLLIRSSEMLLTDWHPAEMDPEWMRIRGYERMAGAVYSELVRSIRGHNGRPGRSKLPIDLNPYAVWQNIAKDPSISLVQDINPIENLKDVEAVTYSGTGGRGSRSMTKHTRAYHPNDMGTISEATKDSADVGINIYTSADPQFTSLRGMSRRFDLKNPDPTSLLSTAALISPASDRDDPKRVNFVSIQHGHTVSCKGYKAAPVRTGYEQVLAHRTNEMFAYTARKPGRVVSVTDTGMVVEYEDGERKGMALGRVYGTSGGLTIPHSIKGVVKEGQKFQPGDLLCYNTGFFEPDILNPDQVVWRAGITVKTVLLEATTTLEDSSSISKRVAEQLLTPTTKVRDIVVNFDQHIHRLVKPGDQVQSEDILCVIENAVTADNKLFDEESLDTLRVLSNQTPAAKTKGTVERVEVFYHGEKEDMSESLRGLANASDRAMLARTKAMGKRGFTGNVDDGFRVEGDPLVLDTAVIRIYISKEVAAGVGDKGVFCNQLKTVFGEVMPYELVSESGVVIDAKFGMKSIFDRIVSSPMIIGTTTPLLGLIAKRAVAAYRK